MTKKIISEPIEGNPVNGEYLYITYCTSYYTIYKYKESITPWEVVGESTKKIWEAFATKINEDFSLVELNDG